MLKTERIEDGLRRLATCTIRESEPMRTWQWGQGVALHGLAQAARVTGDPAYHDYMAEWLLGHLEQGGIGKSINTTAPLLAALELLRQGRGDERLDLLCEEFAAWCLAEAPRSREEAFEHSCTENTYPNEIWADTLFMGGLFLAKWGAWKGDSRCLEESARQFALHYKYLRDEETGLIYHGYDGNSGRTAGVLWGRGNGWYAAATAEVLELLRNQPGYEAVLADFRGHLAAVLRSQHEDGRWHTVLTEPDTYLESSCTAAFVYALYLAADRGYAPDPEAAREAAARGCAVLLEQIDAAGALLGGSGGTCVMPTAREYQAIGYAYSPFTQGLGMLALAGALDPAGVGRL